MKCTIYFLQRTAARGLIMSEILEALAREIKREAQPDGRLRIWGWVESRRQCLRVIIDVQTETLLNAVPDRACTRAILEQTHTNS